MAGHGRGFSLVELLFALALFLVLAGAAVPHVLSGLDASRTAAAARFLASRMALARAQAVARGTAVGIRFAGAAGTVSFASYVDGNGNGIRTGDIASGADRARDPPRLLAAAFTGVEFGLVVNGAILPPVQFGTAGIASFTPEGTASPGTVYVRGRDGAQFAVRVLGATARTRVLRFDAARQQFVAAY
jgi:prepilin-type N-terminal cleavage/methylation domain-containing protein